jgi:hypothetical protein
MWYIINEEVKLALTYNLGLMASQYHLELTVCTAAFLYSTATLSTVQGRKDSDYRRFNMPIESQTMVEC